MQWNKLCDLADWDRPYLTGAVKHRKNWEYEHLLAGLDALSAVHRDRIVLAVGAGHEAPIYTLTQSVRQVFATDLYGSGAFLVEGDSRMLVDPGIFAPCPYDRQRLVVQHMNALDLRFPANFFDIVFCLSSIEHFGGIDAAKASLREMARVIKPGGIVALTTECLVNRTEHRSYPNLELFSPDSLAELAQSAGHLKPVEEFSTALSAPTMDTVMTLQFAIEEAQQGRIPLPHIVLDVDGNHFTSAALFLASG